MGDVVEALEELQHNLAIYWNSLLKTDGSLTTQQVIDVLDGLITTARALYVGLRGAKQEMLAIRDDCDETMDGFVEDTEEYIDFVHHDLLDQCINLAQDIRNGLRRDPNRKSWRHISREFAEMPTTELRSSIGFQQEPEDDDAVFLEGLYRQLNLQFLDLNQMWIKLQDLLYLCAEDDEEL